MMNNQEITEEIQLSDGQTNSIPELQQTNQPEDCSTGCLTMTTTTDDGCYSQGEFESAFNEFLTF